MTRYRAAARAGVVPISGPTRSLAARWNTAVRPFGIMSTLVPPKPLASCAASWAGIGGEPRHVGRLLVNEGSVTDGRKRPENAGPAVVPSQAVWSEADKELERASVWKPATLAFRVRPGLLRFEILGIGRPAPTIPS